MQGREVYESRYDVGSGLVIMEGVQSFALTERVSCNPEEMIHHNKLPQSPHLVVRLEMGDKPFETIQ